MMAFGFMEMMILLLLTGSSPDIVSIMDTKDYFQSRKVELSVDKMFSLATSDPSDGKSQIQQLLALRWLAEHSQEVKKAKNFAKILQQIEEIAAGKKAQDLHGFAKNYGAKTAVALGSKTTKMPVNKMPENSCTKEALAWFPKDSTFSGAMDFRRGIPHGKGLAEMRKRLYTQIPPDFKEKAYQTVELVGNVRLDRVSFAFVYDEQQNRHSQIMFRFTGQIDHKRFVETFRMLGGQGFTIKNVRNFRGRRITQIQRQDDPPVFTIVGNTDVLMTGMESNRGDHMQVTERVLGLRRGKEVNIQEGELKKYLKLLSGKANGVFVGHLPSDMRREMLRGDLSVVPEFVAAQIIPGKKTANLELFANLANADNAKTFAKEVDALKEKGLAALKNPPPLPPGFPGNIKLYDHLRNTLKTLKTEPNGNSVKLKVSVSNEIANGGAFILPFFMLGVRAGAKAPPPPNVQPKPVQKDGAKKESRLRSPSRLVTG